ncbi:glutamyl-tRNA reductase [Algiphilus sp. W345]|uniref:Glutamyl-tRNA reductase n=1 Tax=Banduia mediterranea TaxID=3075609 RepID=A0ABU2WGI6_9GAMM|nr:glutamyl-tRNA reductase [Algiphilus sp. W345]MDT0496980.1 glutamyl-tRNA reductase [Algiphilus sp. W345]
MALITLGLSHHAAPLDVRERLAFTDADLPDALARLRRLPGVSEAAIVSTCNRTEVVTVADPSVEGELIAWWGRERNAEAELIRRYSFTHRDLESVIHKLRVAAGLDSMILGEPQILGQMKQSYAVAQSEKSVGPVLSRLFQHSFAVAKLVRNQTDIGAHPVSVAYAAVTMAKRIFSDLSAQTALLIGAGEMVQLIARHLVGQGVGRIIVANRSLDRAEKLARELHGYAVPLSDLPAYVASADLVIASTGSRDPVLDIAVVKRAVSIRRHKPQFMIDLAVPRDIDPRVGSLEDVYLYTVDDLRTVISENLKFREQAARQGEALVQQYALEFNRWLESRDVGDTIRRIRAKARLQRDEVLERARKRLANGEDPEAVMAFVADTLSNKLLHAPSAQMRKADAVEQAMLMSTAEKLFDLGGE